MTPLLLEIPASADATSLRAGQLYGSSRSLFLAEQIAAHRGLSVVVCSDMAEAEQLEQEIRFFSAEALHVYRFPDLETLPYDQFSPHQDIVSERIRCLASIPAADNGLLILPVSTPPNPNAYPAEAAAAEPNMARRLIACSDDPRA